MQKPEPQYALFEIPTSSKPSKDGVLPAKLFAASTPAPHWLFENSIICGNGIFVVYYSVLFSDNASSALFQNNHEIPGTRENSNQNHGYIILATDGNVKNHIYLRCSPTTALHGKILITELSFREEYGRI